MNKGESLTNGPRYTSYNNALGVTYTDCMCQEKKEEDGSFELRIA